MKINNKKLEFLMAEKCIETRKLSKITGIGEATITRVKNGYQNPKPVTIGKLAKGLGVNLIELLETEN